MSTPNGDAAPGSYYEIEWYSLRMQFASISGLDALPEPDSESIADDGGVYAEPPLPALGGLGTASLHDGRLAVSSEAWTWFDQITMNTLEPTTATITLFDTAATPIRVWTLHEAWPTKFVGTRVTNDESTILVGTVELAYQPLEGTAV